MIADWPLQAYSTGRLRADAWCAVGACGRWDETGGAGIFRSSCTISTLLLQVIWHFDHGDRRHGAAPLSVGKLLRAFADRVRDGVHRKGVVSREDLERLAEGSFPLPLPSAEGRHNAAVRESFQDR